MWLDRQYKDVVITKSEVCETMKIRKTNYKMV